MEEALRLAHRYLIPEEVFWGLTPYNFVLMAQERAKGRREDAFLSGWSAEYCARQKMLSGPADYIRDLFDGEAVIDDGEAIRAWVMENDRRFAAEVERSEGPA